MKVRNRIAIGTAVAMVALLAGVIFGGGSAIAKKKGGGGKKAKPATVTKTVNLPIPDAIGDGTSKTLDGKLPVSLPVTKKFKGTVGRVAITVQTTGLEAGSAGDLSAEITAPDGTTVGFLGGLAGQSIGPLTIQPNSQADTCSFDPAAPVPPPHSCTDPDQTVLPPYAGTVGDSSLNLLNGSTMKGNWTVTFFDGGYDAPPLTPHTSILNSVKLVITPQKPVV